MFNEERKETIVKILQEQGKTTVAELKQVFDVSEVTIRKDLNELHEQGRIIRTHGGAILRDHMRREQCQSEKMQQAFREKCVIGQLAAEEICDLETIMIYGGSTTQQLARSIGQRTWTHLTVITNAINIANELVEVSNVDIVFIGGQLRKGILTCVGDMAVQELSQFMVDRAFTGVSCISLEHGIMAPNMAEGYTVRAMLNAGLKRYVLADSSKFFDTSMFKICQLDDIDTIITDDDVSDSVVELMQEKGKELLLAHLNG